MVDDLIRYDVLYQEALLGLVKKVLGEVAQAGLPGEHHFYVSFDTRAPGVRISSRLHAEYPTEMTVVLQHQFWDLSVTDSAFEVGLSFKGTPERLVVPFRAITSFIDPHAHFQVKFDVRPEEEVAAETVEGALVENEETAQLPEAEEPPAGETTGDVVSLDAFRKKN
jgi:hypothetical protein